MGLYRDLGACIVSAMRPVYDIYQIDSDIRLLDHQIESNRRQGAAAGLYVTASIMSNDDGKKRHRHIAGLFSFIAAVTSFASVIHEYDLQNYRQDLIQYQNALINTVNAPSV